MPSEATLWELLHTYGLTKEMAWDQAKAIYDALLEAEQQETTLGGLREEFQKSVEQQRRSVIDEDWVEVEPVGPPRLPTMVATVTEAAWRTLKLYHGTSWEAAQIIQRDGFLPSSVGCLGRGVYAGHMPKALRFAQDGSRHGGSEGGLVECLVTYAAFK